MPTGLRFLSHSCLLLEDGDGDLLMDPWFFGGVFNDSSSLLAPPDLDTLDLSRLRHVWISHTHPDHFHVPTLRWIRNRVTGPLTAFVRRSPNPTLRKTMSNLGFDVVELRANREHRVTKDLSLTLFTGGHDSSLVVCHRDRVILNQNDCVLDDRTIRRLKRRFPSLDAWFYQFSIGGFFANADDPEKIRAMRSGFLDQIAHFHALLQPTTFVPIASFVRYVKRENAFLNDYAVTPAELMSVHPNIPLQIPWPGDEILWEGWEEASRINENRWSGLFAEDFEIKRPELVNEAQILAAGKRLVRDAPAKVAKVAPPETHIAIAETGRSAVFDFRRRHFSIIESPDPTRLACRMPSEELLYFCSSRYGADVYYGGCFHVVAADLWESLVYFRSSLEPGERWGPWRRMRARVARVDRELTGGRIRAAHHRLLAKLRRR
jgi:hypothetical protein